MYFKDQIKRNIVISIAFVVIFVTVIFLALNLQKKNGNEIISMFREHQIEVSIQASKRIGSHFKEQANELKMLSSLISFSNLNMQETRNILSENLEELRKKHVKSISIYNKNGIIKYSTSSSVIGLNFAQKDFYKWASVRKNNEEVNIFPLGNKYSEILMVSPIISEENKSLIKFEGVISFVIDLEELFNEQLLSSVGDRRDAWIMDKSGMLLYNPSHSDMVSQNINKADESCSNCHLSFDCYNPLFSNEKGSLDYQTKKDSKKLAAFSTVNFMNITWIVVVNVSYDPIDNFISFNFRQTWLLIFLICSVFSIASILLYRFNRSKIIAETEARDLREKEELKKKIELSEEKYRKLTDRVTDLLYAFDNDLKYTYWNKAFEKLTGILAKDALGKSFYDIFPDARDSVTDRTFKQVLKTKESQRFIDEVIIDSNSHHFEIACYPSEDGISIFSRDVTEHIRSEELRKKAEEQLKKYAEELKMSIDTKDKLFSIIAHDLRGPFYPIMTLSEVLDVDIETLSKDEIKEFANIIFESSTAVFTVVKNLLEWSMIQRNSIQFNPKKMDLKNEIEGVINITK
ncbi:MAG: cache domain-containing protein [Methanococcaceae archaeon]